MKKGIFILLSLLILTAQETTAGDFKDKLGIGFGVGGQQLSGDAENGDFETGGSPLIFRFNYKPSVYFESALSYSGLSTSFNGVSLGTSQLDINFKTGYRLWHQKKWNPLLYAGLGVFNYEFSGQTRYWDGYGTVGGGVEYFLGDRFGANLGADYRFTSGNFDTGIQKDRFITVGLAINYYLGGRRAFTDPRSKWVKATQPEPDIEVRTISKSEEIEPERVTTNDPRVLQELTTLTMQKSDLMSSLETREDAAKVLRTKVSSLDDYYQLLQVRAKITGVEINQKANLHDPTDVAFRNGLALYEASDYPAGIDTFSKLLRDHPNHRNAGNWWYWLGESFYGSGDYDAAAKCFRWSLLQASDNRRTEMAYLMIGLSLLKSGNPDKAQIEFTRLTKLAPGTPYETIANRCLTEIELGDSM
jgi:TolA-binding protein